jgi:hypothetical protein
MGVDVFSEETTDVAWDLLVSNVHRYCTCTGAWEFEGSLTQSPNYQDGRLLHAIWDIHCFRHYCSNKKVVRSVEKRIHPQTTKRTGKKE